MDLKFKMFGTSVYLCSNLLVLLSNSASAEDSSPLKCTYRDQYAQIDCQVLVDNAEIAAATFNRGRCATPILTSQHKELLQSVINKSSPQLVEEATSDKKTVEYLLGDHLAVMTSESFEKAINALPLDRKLSLAQAVLKSDKAGTYHFADTVSLSTMYCRNLLEYTITVNGEILTWSIR